MSKLTGGDDSASSKKASKHKDGKKGKKKDDDDDESLAIELKRVGLEVSTWEYNFNKEGMRTKTHLQYTNISTLNRLLKQTKHEWEKGALRKLCYENKQEEFVENASKIDEMRKKLPDSKKDLADALQKEAEGRTMGFDDKPWMKDFDREREMRLIQKESSGEETICREIVKGCDIIRKISAGQLLRGQFIHGNLEKSSTYRHQLIEVDDDIELMAPGINETMEIIEIYDRKQSEKFDAVLDQFGMSFAMAFHAGFKKFIHIDGQASGSHANTSQSKESNDVQESYVKIKQILVVPTASFTLSNQIQSVSLSKCASDALILLNRRFVEEKSIDHHCELFFREFGSHFFTGVCHFGGRYKWEVTSTTDSTKNLKESYESAKSALSGSVGGGYLWFGGEIKGAAEKNKQTVTETRTFSESIKVEKKLEKSGGPQENDEIKFWKKGLAEYNSTWVVIDKDVSQKCYEGVWTLLKNQENYFQDTVNFGKAIHQVWNNNYSNYSKGDAMTWSKPQLFLDCNSESDQYSDDEETVLDG